MENQRGNAGNLPGNEKYVGNQGGNTRNYDGNLSITVKITYNRNGNYKFKAWRDVKIIESKNTCKNLISHI